jgi:hypothetical protein
MSQPESLPINCAARNSTWVYDAFSPPRFGGAPTIVERARSHHMPDFGRLPEAADIAVELYGGAVTLRLDGETRRIYTGKFDYVSYRTGEEARHALLTLWREVERLDSSDAVRRAAAEWLERQQRV